VESNFKPVECLKPWIHSYQEKEAWILGDKVMAPGGGATKIDQQAKLGRSHSELHGPQNLAIMNYGQIVISKYVPIIKMLRVKVSEEVERKFRELAMKRFGYMKGSLSKAAEEAFLMWISNVQEEEWPEDQDPVEAIDGLLSGVDADSVELQHITKLWAKRELEDVPD